MAKAIAESEEAEEFIKSPTDVASLWLETHPGTPGELYKEFIERHGHRSIKEFDLMTETWGLNPKSLISVLQSMASNPSSYYDEATNTAANDGCDWMKGFENCKPSKLRALKFAVPKCRQTVVARETTKSLLIKTIHLFRLAYRRLAHLLVLDGKLPDDGLVFYLTHQEIGDLIRSPKTGAGLLTKAKRRRKIHTDLENLVFPEICRGVPTPEQVHFVGFLHVTLLSQLII